MGYLQKSEDSLNTGQQFACTRYVCICVTERVIIMPVTQKYISTNFSKFVKIHKTIQFHQFLIFCSRTKNASHCNDNELTLTNNTDIFFILLQFNMLLLLNILNFQFLK